MEIVPIGTGSKNKNIFPRIPLPNWRITYDGISKMEWAKKYFNTVTLSHHYRSTYNINSYITTPDYVENVSRNDTNDFKPKYEILQVTISEQFSPFFGIDINWKNSLTTKLDYKKDRNVSLSMSNTQVNETRGYEYSLGLGYRYKRFKVPFKVNNRTVRLENDLVFGGNFSFRRSLTITRQLTQQSVQTTGGIQTFKIGLSIDYMVNERLNLRLFYDRTRNIPELSTSFPTTNWNGGISIKFTITG